MNQADQNRLAELSGMLDDVDVCGERFDLIQSVPGDTDSVELVRLLFRNLSTSPENSQWTFDESTIGVIESVEPRIWIEAFWREFNNLANAASDINRSHCHYFISKGCARYEEVMRNVFEDLEIETKQKVAKIIDQRFLEHYQRNPNESKHCWAILNHVQRYHGK